MVALEHPLVVELLRRIRFEPELDLGAFVSEHGEVDEDTLADLINADARARLAAGLHVGLDRYLDAIDNLPSKPVAFDAAVEFALRQLSGSDRPKQTAVEQLVRAYPEHAESIRTCAVLSDALWTTQELERVLHSPTPRRIPSEIGPVLPSGDIRYELRELLGHGADGSVYLAVDRHLSEPEYPAWVAVKIFEPRLGQASLQRLVDEATMARRVDHENVVRVLDHGLTQEQEGYIVYEWIDGPHLKAWFEKRSGPLPPKEAARLTAAVARGVQAAHSAGLVHCDLKPTNILINSNGKPMVADFGTAIRLEMLHESIDESEPRGNWAFMAPEQFRREEGSLAIPADVYALGGILYYLLTGGLPNGETFDEVAENHDAANGRTEAERLPAAAKAPRDLEAICRRALSPLPADRHASADALAADLESWLRNEPLRWTNPSRLRSAGLLAKRNPLAVGAVSLSLVGGLGGTAYLGLLAQEQTRRIEKDARLLHQAEVDKAVLRQESAQHDRMARLSIMQGIRAADQMRQAKSAADVLTFITLFESLLGPMFYPEMGHDPERWATRIDIAHKHLAYAAKEGGESELLVMLWRTGLSVWLIRADDFKEAEPLAKENVERWKRMLPEDDPFINQLRCVEACAAINRLSAAKKDRPLTDEERAELHRISDLLSHEKEYFSGAAAGTPMHRLVFEGMDQLYSRDLLDDPNALRAVIDRADRLFRGG